MRTTSLALLAVVLGTASAIAEPETWIAVSKTATAITGDIVLDEYSLTFANGESLDLEPYEQDRVGDWSGSGNETEGYVYKIDPPADPELNNGNTLCGAPVSWLVIRSPGKGELVVNAYSGEETPTGTDGLCASYSFEAP